MEYKHYKFSNEVKPELLQFYKIASKKKHQNPNIDLWKVLLPKDTALLNQLTEMQIDSVIDLTEENTSPIKKDSEDITLQTTGEQLELNISSVNDIIESVMEHLEVDGNLSNDIFIKLSKYKEQEMDEIFMAFSELDTEVICKFGNSIIENNCVEQTLPVKYFIKHILIPKIFIEHSTQIHSLFVDFLNTFPNVTSQEISDKLDKIEDTSKCIQDNLNSLSSTQKQKILRYFILNTRTLDKQHFPIIDCLLSNEIDIETLRKLMELLTAISSIFSNDKTFGKLLLNIISNSKHKIVYFEQQFTHIISLHRSVWKNKLNKNLDECRKDIASMSQNLSLMY